MQRRTAASPCHCINLRRANSAVTAFYDRALAPLGLTVSQYSLLVNLGRLGPASVSRLAGKMGLERTTLTRTIKPLLAQNLIEDGSPPDCRDRRLSLTRTGRAKVDEGLVLWEEAQKAFESQLGPTRLSLLNQCLAALEALA